MENVENLRRLAQNIYLTNSEGAAKNISAIALNAANELEALKRISLTEHELKVIRASLKWSDMSLEDAYLYDKINEMIKDYPIMSNKVPNKFVCPLCKEAMEYIEARIECSGEYYRASVRCSCGFSFTPEPRDYLVRKGEDGWSAISRDIRKKEAIIFKRFGVFEDA